MKQLPLIVTVAVALTATPAVAHHATQIPQGGPKLAKTYAKLYAKAPDKGRNVLLHGRAKDGKFSWSEVREDANRMWLDLHPLIKREHERDRIYKAITEKRPHWPLNKRIVYAWWMANGKSETNFNCLAEIINGENAFWDPTLDYGGGHGNIEEAYGVPQANPGKKMAVMGPKWATSPILQVVWMEGYTYARYGSPCKAVVTKKLSGVY